MADTQTTDELLSWADDLALDNNERLTLALILFSLLEESFEDGYRRGWHTASGDFLVRTSNTRAYNSH